MFAILRYSLVEPRPRQNHASPSTQTRPLKSNELFLSVSVIWFYVLIILAAAIGLALNVSITEFVDTVCSRHILACMAPSYILVM